VCGIAGFSGHRPDAAVLIESMTGALVHRGPDDDGVHLAGDIALGMRRLAIIDVQDGRQPYRNETGDVVAVFNGEIYGFAALRDRLRRLGHRFESGADGEVIVHAWEEFGEDFVEHIDGMFAIALWDDRRKTLVLVRDRVGKKPLYVAELAGGEVSFASELQSLLRDPAVPREVDVAAVASYLRLGYVPAPGSAFAGVRKLHPGTMLVCGPEGVRERRYWSVPYEPKAEIAYGDAVEEFDRMVGDAVRRRLISDVPLGALLSGGLDSSYVVAHMVRAANGPVETFTIGFSDDAYDERAHARAIAERLGTVHHEQVVEPSDLTSVLPLLVRHYGEPYADSSSIPTYYLSRMASGSITVALAGDGGDELLAGYERHTAARLATAVDRLPVRVRAALGGAGTGLFRGGPDPKSRGQKLHRFFASLGMPAGERFADWAGTLTADEYAALEPGAPHVALPEPPGNARRALDRVLEADLHGYLPGDLLAKIDIASMACSLEVRAPLLDHRLVEWTARLPVGYKQRGLQRKRLMHDGLALHLPRELFDRPKMGFAAPIARWMRGELRELVSDALLEPRSVQRGWVDGERVERAMREHFDGRRDNSRALWTLLMLELWHREYVDAPIALAAPAAAR
jgi:asparagine synthase (glutamine-hydrolysing)